MASQVAFHSRWRQRVGAGVPVSRGPPGAAQAEHRALRCSQGSRTCPWGPSGAGFQGCGPQASGVRACVCARVL